MHVSRFSDYSSLMWTLAPSMIRTEYLFIY